MPTCAKLALVVCVAGCMPRIPPHTAHVPPRLFDVRPPQSVLFVTGSVPLDTIDEALKAAIPESIAGSTRAGGLRLRWDLVRRSARLGADANGLVLDVSIAGFGDIEAPHVHCGGEQIGVALEAHARPALDEHGQLALRDVQVTLRPAGDLRCGLVPVGSLLTEALQPLARGLAAALAAPRVPLGPAVDVTLDALSRPVPIPPLEQAMGGPACLDLAPASLVLAPLHGTERQLSLAVGVELAPRLAIGECPPRTPSPPREVRAREMPLGEEFAVLVSTAIAYDTLAAKAAGQLIGRVLGEGRDSIIVRGLELADAQGRVLVKMQVDGRIQGTVALWGTPTVTQHEGRWLLTVPDLQLAVETRSLLTRLGLGAWNLWNGGLQAKLRRELVVDVTDRLEQLRAMMDRDLALPVRDRSIVLSARMHQILPQEVTSRPGAMVANALLVGRAAIK
jgi:hypothetical protein